MPVAPRIDVDATRPVDLRKLPGEVPAIAFDEGIRGTVEWFRANESWWRPIKQGEFRAYYERMYGQRKVLKGVGA